MEDTKRIEKSVMRRTVRMLAKLEAFLRTLSGPIVETDLAPGGPRTQ